MIMEQMKQPFYALSTADALAAVEASTGGLNRDEVTRRLEVHGVFAPNSKHRQRIVAHRPEGRLNSDKPPEMHTRPRVVCALAAGRDPVVGNAGRHAHLNQDCTPSMAEATGADAPFRSSR